MRRLTLFAAIVSLVACGGADSTPTAPTVTIAGTWALRAVNGTSLPYSFPPSSGSTATVTVSTLTLSANSTYNEITSVRIVTGATTITTSVTELGTWSANAGTINFNDQTDHTTYQGSVSGSTLTEIVSGYTQVYARQ